MDPGFFYISVPKRGLFFLKVHERFSLPVGWKATSTVGENLICVLDLSGSTLREKKCSST